VSGARAAIVRVVTPERDKDRAGGVGGDLRKNEIACPAQSLADCEVHEWLSIEERFKDVVLIEEWKARSFSQLHGERCLPAGGQP
jgi:hypothetical protein